MYVNKYSFFYLIFILLLINCKNDEGYIGLNPEEGEAYSGGETTFFNLSPEAFGFKAPNLGREFDASFGIGNALFRRNWVEATTTSVDVKDGLGPFFNAKACSGCHFKDGRGRAPLFNGEAHGMLIRLSIPGTTSTGDNMPEPTYGDQFQPKSLPNITAQGDFTITYTDIVMNYPDGKTTILQKPIYHFINLGYGAMHGNLEISPRVGPQMPGLGLLEAIPDETLIGFSDEFDANNDGISGKVNRVWNKETQSFTIGRFGWKANNPSVKQQVAGAFSGDMGLTTSLFPDHNCPDGVDCNNFIHGGEPEISDIDLDRITIYSSTLNVPGRRNHDKQEILEGKKLFNELNCTACHIPKIQTGTHLIAALTNQTIRPYTDLLLHDMGDQLADNRPDFDATGNEWRTPPLWGIGLIEIVNNHTNLLHDGRARNIEEAILWHGGESEASKIKFMNLKEQDRIKVINFIKSL